MTTRMFDYSAGSRRSPWGSAASLFAHMAAVALLTSVTYGQVAAPEIKRSTSITYVSLSTPRPPAESYAPPRTVPAAPKPQAVAAVPVAPRVDALAVVAPAPVLPRPLPSRLEPPAPVAPQERPAEPPITTGLFRIGSATAASAPAASATQVAGFDRAPAAASGTASTAPVAAAGFESRRSAAAAAPAAAVSASGFDAAPPQPAARPRASAPAVKTSVEVLFKPTPAYTEEARANGVQGDVLLEVDFTASGAVRVVRVVRGLGHGLDEMAVRAARQIRFKPATEDGRPIDVRAQIQIVFRLT